MPDEQQLSPQDQEARTQNIATIQARRKQVVARLQNAGDTERAKLQEELDSIDANLQAMGEEVEHKRSLSESEVLQAFNEPHTGLKP
jgi:hypothetical protein